MSRCFPYPPPGCSRNGATYESLIESIKLHKENEKPKPERKKEKRSKKEKKEKKEKEKRKVEEKDNTKLQNNPSEYQVDAYNKGLQNSVDFKEAPNKRTKPNNEQLERSDLTEEHGQPISSNKPSYSSDSTQNSNKRKRDDAVIPEGSSGQGKLIKIRLLKKQKVPDCSNSGRSDLQSLSGADAQSNSLERSTSVNNYSSVPPLVSSNRNNGVPATSGRENKNVATPSPQRVYTGQTKSTPSVGRPTTNTQGLRFVRQQSTVKPEKIQNNPQGYITSQTKSTPSVDRPATKINNTQGLRFVRQQTAPQSAVKSETKNNVELEVVHSSRQRQPPPVPSYRRPVVARSEFEHEKPTSSSILEPPVSRKFQVQGPVFTQNGIKCGLPSADLLNTTKSTVAGKRSINEITTPVNTGTSRFEKKKEDSVPPVAGTSKGEEKAGLSKSERKLQKKHKKYEKLIGSWAPPVLQPQLVDDDEDWLSGSGKKAKSSSVDDVCGDSAAPSSLWQPCARFLVEADIHALPYTVPF